MIPVIAVLASYLLGSIPFAYLITRLATGKDIRHEGEGNVGTRNVMHVVGTWAGLLTFVLDAGKGLAAYWLCSGLGVDRVTLYLAGCAAVLGHGFPVWLGWRGGKGLATMFGFVVSMWPWAGLAGLVVLFAALALIKTFDPAMTVASLALLLFTYIEGRDLWGTAFVALLLVLAGVKKLVDLKHERATRAASGWIESPSHLQRTQRDNT